MFGRSQNNEDTIIREIFRDIGDGNKRFVEFGCGDGRQNNTIRLLIRGWSGVWFEPHKKRCNSAKERWKHYPVEIRRRLITPDKVNVVIKDPIDFLSIDVDGDDYYIWAALKARPRIVCIEVGDPNGIPLPEMKELAKAKGYEFVMTSDYGINAFFRLV